MNLEQQIKVAEKRIYDAECRRAEFARIQIEHLLKSCQ